VALGAANTVVCCVQIVSSRIREEGVLDGYLVSGWSDRYVVDGHEWCSRENVNIKLFDNEGIKLELKVIAV
jgi:hypothetical protein